MPPPPRPDPPNRSVKVTFSGRVGSAPWSNTMWLFLTGEGEIDHSTLINLANACFGAYSDTIKIPMSTDATLDVCEVVLWFNGEEFSANSTHVSVAGEQGGLCAPASVSCCISWPIAQHYRGGHPRTYLAGIPVSAFASTTLFDIDYTNNVQADARELHTRLEAIMPGEGVATVLHGIVSFVSAGAWRVPPTFRRIQEDAFVDRRIDTQRRRLGRDLPQMPWRVSVAINVERVLAVLASLVALHYRRHRR